MNRFKTPQDDYGELFELVQAGRVFPDSKTFVDAIPRQAPTGIMRLFGQQRGKANFDLKSFVESNFDLPRLQPVEAALPAAADVQQQIEALWTRLTRKADRKEPYSSLIELPKPYVVPGGRFRELYYWDSYFTMLGLADSGRTDLLRDMVDNFAYLIDTVGFIPNGTRSYFCTRSQPPFFVLMIDLLADVSRDKSVYQRYLPQLRKEYEFWMTGHEELGEQRSALRRVVKVGDTLLNRYWDSADLPRQESYAEDIELASRATRDDAELYRDLRAACESGWDFGSRWFGESGTIESICTTGILPIDLNSIMYRLETVLGETCEATGESLAATLYRDRAGQRKAAIRRLFFDSRQQFFFDIHVDGGNPTAAYSLAAAFPLFFRLCTEEQAAHVATKLASDFLRAGGWVTTPVQTGQQWDAPNGWAPLQWIVFEGLRNYGYADDARTGAGRWVDNNIGMFRKTGRFMEKYNVEEPSLAATGGEYVVQDGFGWTNGVLLRLLDQGLA
jgi:alpha,alpha-trehalase